MSFSCGIVGLPNCGKSTIFNALTALSVAAQPYPFCTIEPNIGVVPVPDDHLLKLGELLKPEKLTPTTIEFIDIAGLIKDAHKGEGLGNRFLGHVRNVDAIAHVVRIFQAGDVPHVYAHIDPLRDIEIVETEIIIADLEMVEERLQKIERLSKVSKEKGGAEREVLAKVKPFLEGGAFLLRQDFDDAEWELVRSFNLITAKPLFYVANVGEEHDGTLPVELEQAALSRSRRVVAISGKLEAELAVLGEADQCAYLDLYGLAEMSIGRVIRVGYEVLSLVTFYTIVGKEIRAWTVPAGTTCARAAGKIHSDMEHGFIKAEVVNVGDFIRCGSEHVAREKGLLRIEGRDYTVRDGDILHIRFNV